jgi:hypothetical protein
MRKENWTGNGLRDPGEGEESLKELNLNWRGGTFAWVFAKVGVLERREN